MGQVSFIVPKTGQWAVSGSLGGKTITQTVNVTDKNVIYPIEFLFNSAQITVISPVGTSLLLQNGTSQLTKISTGTDVFIVSEMGTWTISGTLDGYTLNSTSLTVQNGGEYQTQLSIQIATLTVNAPSGTIVTVSGNGQQNQQTVTEESVVFNLTALNSYTISGTNGSFVTSAETIEVTSFQPYSVTLTLSIAKIIVTTIDGTLVQARTVLMSFLPQQLTEQLLLRRKHLEFGILVERSMDTHSRTKAPTCNRMKNTKSICSRALQH